VTSVTLPYFNAVGPIQAKCLAVTCEQATLQGRRLIRVPNRALEYDLKPDPGASVEMLRWAKSAKGKEFDPLRADVTLLDLAELADQPDTELIKWVSKWGSLGFRPLSPLSGEGLITYIMPGRDRFFGPDHRVVYGYEPLALIRESITVAKAATTIFQVLKMPSIHDRARKIKELILPDDSTRVGNEIQMWIFGVGIGKHPQPRKPVDYDRLALGGLGVLTDLYLDSELQLYWTEQRKRTREICLGWKVQSLLGALYLKLGYVLRRTRCQVCGDPIGHRRQGATTCGPACRQQKSRMGRKRDKTE